MCKFQMMVNTNNAGEVAVAKERFGAIANVSAVSVCDDGKKVVADAELTGEYTQLKLTGWAKDSFGIHPTMNPSVRIMTQ